MAHLLEHLLFKGSKRHPNVKEEFTRRGARWNGTTSNDRTNYFETLAATDDNLEWAIGDGSRPHGQLVRVEAGPRQRDDRGAQRVRDGREQPRRRAVPAHAAARLPLAQLRQPDHRPARRHREGADRAAAGLLPHLVPAGQRGADRRRDVSTKPARWRWSASISARSRAPARVLPAYYTDEPTQDGERRVRLERVGDNQIVSAMYRAPSGSHPDYPAIDVLAQRARRVADRPAAPRLVQKGLGVLPPGARSAGCTIPATCTSAPRSSAKASSTTARERAARDGRGREAGQGARRELERARTALLNDFEKVQLDTGALVRCALGVRSRWATGACSSSTATACAR